MKSGVDTYLVESHEDRGCAPEHEIENEWSRPRIAPAQGERGVNREREPHEHRDDRIEDSG